MHRTLGVLFAFTFFSTSALSFSMMGAGVWFWIIIGVGLFVAVSQYSTVLRGAGAGLATLLSVISICAVLLGLVAATIGGSFRLETNEAFLLLLFFVIAVLGFCLGRSFKNSIKND